MKTKKIIFFILMFLPLVVSGVCLFFLPDEFPSAVAGLNLIVTDNGMASKFNTLIFPAVCLFFGLLILFMAKNYAKEHEDNKRGPNIISTVGIALLAFFNLLNIFLLYIAFMGFKSLDELSFDIYKVVFIALGILMIVMGNLMPKARMNAFYGLRTPWSMKDEESWKKCQHFGGIVAIVEGIVLIITAALTKAQICVAACLVIVFVFALITMFGSLKVVAKDVKKEQKENKKESK